MNKQAYMAGYLVKEAGTPLSWLYGAATKGGERLGKGIRRQVDAAKQILPQAVDTMKSWEQAGKTTTQTAEAATGATEDIKGEVQELRKAVEKSTEQAGGAAEEAGSFIKQYKGPLIALAALSTGVGGLGLYYRHQQRQKMNQLLEAMRAEEEAERLRYQRMLQEQQA